MQLSALFVDVTTKRPCLCCVFVGVWSGQVQHLTACFSYSTRACKFHALSLLLQVLNCEGVLPQARSLLTAHEDFTTLMFTSPTEIQRPGLVFTFLKKYMPSEATVEEVKRMSLTADGKSAVFDVPSKLAQV